MGLKGNLANVSLADVFQTLSHGHSTGLLRIQTPEGTRFVEIQDGAISIVSRTASRVPLGDLLVARGLLADAALKQALSRQKESGKLLGEVLIELGLVQPAELEAALRFQVEEEICDLFLLKEAEFDFLANANLDATMALAGGFMRLRIDPNSLLLEAARRVDEWRKVEQRIPSQAALFVLTAGGQDLLNSKEGLSAEGLMLLQLVHDHRSVESMVHKACLGRLNTNLLLLELSDAGLVQPAPIETYSQTAADHLTRGRLDEAERVADYASRVEVDAVRREGLKRVLSEVQKKKRLVEGADSAQAGRVRSEVIRRPNPALIIQHKRSPYPIVIGVIAVLLLAGGAAYWYFSHGGGGGKEDEINQFNALMTVVEKLMQDGQYAKALEQLQARFRNPEINQRAEERFRKYQKDLEAEMGALVKRANAALDKADEPEVEKVVGELKRFDGVNIFTGVIFGDLKKLRERLDQWSERGVAVKYRAQLKALESKPPKVRADELAKLLAEQPPESVAAEARDGLADLAERRRKSQRLLERGHAREQVGYWAGARASYNEVGTAFPDSDEDQQAHERIQGLDKLIAQADAKLREIDVAWIQNRRDQAKEELQKLLPFKQNADSADAARQLWRRFVPNVDGETGAEQLLREAAQLEGRQQDEAVRQKKIELLALYPYSLTATRVELKVKIESVPKGAKVRVNSKAADQPTPVTVNVPASGLVRITLEKPGYAESEAVAYDFRETSFLARMVREPVERPRRLPAPAAAGLAGLKNRVALPVGGQLYLVDLAKPSTEPLERKALETATSAAEAKGPPPLFGPTMLPSARGDDVELLLATSRKAAWRVTLPAGNARAIPLLGVPALPPLPFTDKAAPDRIFLAVATGAGLECYETTDGKPRFPVRKLGNDDKVVPTGLASSGPKLFVASSDGKLRGWPATAGEGWEAALVPGFVTPLAAMAGGDAVAVGADGQQMAWDAKTGKARGPRNLGGKFALGLAACAKGFLALSNAGKLELLAPDGEKSVWSKELPAANRDRWPKGLSAEAGAFVAAVGESFAVVAVPAELYLVKLADGEPQWRAPLDSPPVALSVGGTRIYLSTADACLWVFEAE